MGLGGPGDDGLDVVVLFVYHIVIFYEVNVVLELVEAHVRFKIFHYGLVQLSNYVVAFIVLKEGQVLFLQKFCVDSRFLPVECPIHWFDWWWGWRLRDSLNKHKSSFSLAHSFRSISLTSLIMSIWTVAS